MGIIEEDIRESLNSKYFENSLRGTQKLEPGDDMIRNSLLGSYKGSVKEDIRGSYKSQNINSHVEEVLR